MKIEINKSKDKIHQVLCQECKRNTNHLVLQSIDISGMKDFPDGGWYGWRNDYQIIQCQGCETISFRIESANSEDWDPDHGDYITEVIYPRRTVETINAKDFKGVPYDLRRVYKETIDCYNNDLVTLCGAGVRIIVEGICGENHVTGGVVKELGSNGTIISARKSNLQGKINGLFEKGILTEENANALHEHRFLGNESVHELSAPTKKELSLAIGIIEHIFDSIYEIPAKASELKKVRKKSDLFEK